MALGSICVKKGVIFLKNRFPTCAFLYILNIFYAKHAIQKHINAPKNAQKCTIFLNFPPICTRKYFQIEHFSAFCALMHNDALLLMHSDALLLMHSDALLRVCTHFPRGPPFLEDELFYWRAVTIQPA